jgi:nitrite reductase (NO-forming) / hydroxylamine reductase
MRPGIPALAVSVAVLLLGGCGRPGGSPAAGSAPEGDAADGGGAVLSAVERGERIFRGHCASCHSLGQGDRRHAPDLLNVTTRRPVRWLQRWLADPAEVAANNPYGQQLVRTWKVVMPDPDLDDAGIADVLAFLEHQSALGPLAPTPPVALTPEQFEATRGKYFDRCAGCHGTLRGGATGPDISEDPSRALGTDALAATLRHGTPWGMPAWGKQAVLSETDIAQLAAFLQLPAPPGPPLTLDDARASWQLLVPTAARPGVVQHARDWQNFFGVILRDSGKVAIFDGDSREEVARIDTGFAVHILRSSSSGRYFYAIGRDGWVTLIDLWAAAPQAVAKVRGCFDARSVEGSKFLGYEDRYVVEGCYWPSQYVVFDGLTLEPLAVHGVLGSTVDTHEPLAEVRVASIVAVRDAPLWALSLKESGHVALVDYSAAGFPVASRIDAERFLHDGGLDRTGRYFLAAANARNRMAVVDLQARTLVTTFESGVLPHPGRGANWLDPTYGWVNATTHLGEPTLAVYGADPSGHPEHAWKVVRKVTTPTAGSLFLKTHASSPWVLFDQALSTDVAAARQICAYSKERGVLDRCFAASTTGPALQPEFNRAGTEVWVSVWDDAGAVVVYDAVTLAEKARLTGLDTPTGKFNVFNTAHDVY